MKQASRSIGPISLYRCTEAVDPQQDYTFRTVYQEDGRSIEIATSRNQMLLDRHLAKQLALALLEICGDDQPDELGQGVLEIVYGESGAISFRQYSGVPPHPRTVGPLFDPPKSHG